jgi:GxxExxY protein
MIFNAEDTERAEAVMQGINLLTRQIIGAAIEVHREKGPGLLESAYESCLVHELTLRGLNCARQVAVPLTYKGTVIAVAFRADLIVEDKVLVELKAI